MPDPRAAVDTPNRGRTAPEPHVSRIDMPPQPQSPAVLTLAEKVHRPAAAVRAELDAAKARHAELNKTVTQQWERRNAALSRRLSAEKQWKANPMNAGVEFDPELFAHLAVPRADSDETVAYHKIHETIARLENELTASRRAAIDG